MPELLHPGVYVLEVPSGARPIEGVSTSTAAFIGMADRGPVVGTTLPSGRMARPVMVTSFTEYSRTYGGFRTDSFLTYAARAFFDNGGRRLYVVRVANGATVAAAAALSIVQAAAAAPGVWSGQFSVAIAPASGGNAARFDLVVNAVGPSGPVPVERFTNLTTGGGGNAQAQVNGGSKFVRLAAQPATRPDNTDGLAATVAGIDGAGATAASVTTAGANGILVAARNPGAWANANLTVSVVDATDAQAGDFNLVVKLAGVEVETLPNLTFNSGPPAPANYARTVVNAPATGSRYITLPSDFSARPTNAADQALVGGTDGAGGVAATWGAGAAAALGASAANEGLWGNAVGVAVAASSDRDPSNFKLLVTYDGPLGTEVVETYDNVTFQNSPTLLAGAPHPAQYARTLVNSRSEYLALTADFTNRPASSPLNGNNRPVATRLTGGGDGGAVSANGYIGLPAPDNSVTGTGLFALDKVTDVNLIAIPGQGDPATVNAGAEYCKNRPLQDCFFIGDVGTLEVTAARMDGATPTVSLLGDVRDFATTGFAGTPLDKSAGDYGAIYYPWVWSADPIGSGQNPRVLLPPSGFLTGIYARIDNSRGVFKAPAGTEAGVSGALAVATTVSDTEQDELNPIDVNVIRTVPGSGIVVWGTRTFASDAAWRYVPVRRIAIFLRVSIYYGIQWAVFEPNDEPLWSSLRTNIRAFMLTQFRAGAFQGSTPDEAFFVKCDSSTTTQQDIDNGVVNILVGFAPLKPAEFVVLRLSQKVNQPAT